MALHRMVTEQSGICSMKMKYCGESSPNFPIRGELIEISEAAVSGYIVICIKGGNDQCM